MNEDEVWTEVGSEGFDRIVAGFYRRVREDDLIGPMYPEGDWEGAQHRLAGFLKFRIGMDPSYTQERGHPRLRMRHMPFSIGEQERDRWLQLMAEAVEEEGIREDIATQLMSFFAQVAEFMQNR